MIKKLLLLLLLSAFSLGGYSQDSIKIDSVQLFTGGKIVKGALYKDASGNVWVARRDISNSLAQPKEGTYWTLIQKPLAPIPPVVSNLIFAQDYLIEQNGDTIIATPKRFSKNPSFKSINYHYVLQSVVNALTVKGKRSGGEILIAGVVKDLWDEVVVNGWEDGWPTSKLVIKGVGATKILQYTKGKNAIVVKNRAAFTIEGIDFEIGPESLSAIKYSRDGVNSEISVTRGNIHDVYIHSTSTLAPAVYLQNFFGLSVNNLSIWSTNYTGLHLENASTTTQYGNSQFGIINLNAPPSNNHSGLLISSINHLPMNLNHFVSTYIGAINGIGQTDGAGIDIYGGATNTFDFVDIEYMPYPIRVRGWSGKIESYSNHFRSGYLYASDKGTAIEAQEATAGNTFDRLTIDANNGSVMIINDKQLWRPANNYDHILVGSAANLWNLSILTKDRTVVNMTQNGTLGVYRSEVK